ncbi:hypothetical protein [Pseudoroseicyclus aestuarii]|uniref:Uncharacterized protein n=1 Tax=Pseudoroseicyclus aestuarii TaxID=1795041 RepID=A0A318SR65_9RHOB|nr:hypothetical protein [Pseudoroseicyclus aestuarii]PYE84431.1 hypothetical protein DFP88_102230 [Pseudoroseicyclus aestuarii]
MLKTITLGSCVQVQGLLVKQLEDGSLVVSVGDRTYRGRPVSAAPAAFA